MTKDATDKAVVSEEAQQAQSVALPILAQLGIQISDPQVVALRIAQSLADAATPQDLLAEGGTASWRDRADIPFKIRGVEWSESDLAGGVGFFAIVTAVNLNTGATEILTTGATNAVIQIAKLVREGWLDRAVTYSQRQAASGFYVGRLLEVEDPTVPFD